MRGLAAAVTAGALLVLSGGTALAASAQPTSPSSAPASGGPTSSARAASSPASATASGSSAVATPGPGSVNPFCSAEVADPAGVLSGDDVEQLRSAAQDLAQTTMLRVRTVASVPGGDLNAYEQQVQRSCGWADAANQRQPTLLVVMVDTDDRRMGIYPGPALTGVLTDKVWLGIEQVRMRPSFATGDWTDGLQAGIEALDQLVGPGADPSASFDPSLPPSAADSGSASSAVTRATSAPAVASPPIDDGGSGFPTGGTVAGIAAAFVLVGALTVAVRRSSLRRPFGEAAGWAAADGVAHHGYDGGLGGMGDGGSSFGDGGGGGSSSDGGGGSSGF